MPTNDTIKITKIQLTVILFVVGLLLGLARQVTVLSSQVADLRDDVKNIEDFLREANQPKL